MRKVWASQDRSHSEVGDTNADNTPAAFECEKDASIADAYPWWEDVVRDLAAMEGRMNLS